LRADNRSNVDERAFQAWLSEDAAHAAAFESVNAMWEAAGGLTDKLSEPVLRRQAPVHRRALLAGMGACATAVVGGSVWQSAYAGVYSTDVGEQKHVALEDGTQVFLDTDTRIRVDFSNTLRRVALERGRANFRVAPDSKRLFVVEGAGRQIVGSGTSFDARRDGDRISVVLISGRAALQPDAAVPAQKPVELSAGERAIATETQIRRDKPNLVPLLAWQTGQAIFENEKLADAAAEMNRYTTTKLVVDDAEIGSMRLSGVYRVGDNTAFARSVASLLPVSVEWFSDHVELVRDNSRVPQG
jgi:transmembrane sensor